MIREYTYCSSQFNSFSRLDFLLVSSPLEHSLLETEVGPRLWSDHAWVETRICMLDKLQLKPCWKLNSNMLYLEPMYSDIKKETLNYFEFNSECGVSPQIVWDAMNVVIRDRFISSSSSAYLKQKEKYKRKLLLKIAQLEKQHKHTCSTKVYRSLLVERKKIDFLETLQIQKNVLFLKHHFWLRTPKDAIIEGPY